jgi:hypothetical protein
MNTQSNAAYCDQRDRAVMREPLVTTLPLPEERPSYVEGLRRGMSDEMSMRFRRMLALIRSQIVLAGGREISDEGIAKMTAGEMLSTFARNGINFEPKFERSFAEKYLVSMPQPVAEPAPRGRPLGWGAAID